MIWKYLGYGAVILILLVSIGGIGFVIIRPTSKTVVSAGGRVINVNTESPQIPLGGCSVYRVNAKLFWERGFNMRDKNAHP